MDALVYILYPAAAGKFYIGHTTEPMGTLIKNSFPVLACEAINSEILFYNHPL